MLRTAQLITREDPLKLKGRLRKSSDVLFDWAISVLVVVVAVDVEVLQLVPRLTGKIAPHFKQCNAHEDCCTLRC